MKYDFSTLIDGYDGMSAEEKVAAIAAFDFDDGKAEVERYKAAASKANGEAAEWKRKHNALLSEDEQKRAADAEELEQLRTTVAALTKEKTVAAHKAEYIALGYSAELAEKTAVALAEGDMTTVLANQRAFLEAHDNAVKAELMGGTPTPKTSNGGKTMTVKDIYAIKDPVERQKAIQENIDLFQ